ncbi:hypothetical protein TNCV_3704311 [Trichonephila clavipes]|nr:hypothetical protein TNCV_3704311 [Trichonephila clavipes]
MLQRASLKKRGGPRKQPLIPRGTAGENAIMSDTTPPHVTVFGGVGEESSYRLHSRKIQVRQFCWFPIEDDASEPEGKCNENGKRWKILRTIFTE